MGVTHCPSACCHESWALARYEQVVNLLVLSQYYWPENFGITTLTRSISTQVKISILTGQPNYPDGVIYKGYSALGICAEHFEGLEIFRVPLIPRGHKSSLMLAINYLSFIVSATLIAPWLLRGRRFDAILVYAPSPLLQAIPAIFLARLSKLLCSLGSGSLARELECYGFCEKQMVTARCGLNSAFYLQQNGLRSNSIRSISASD